MKKGFTLVELLAVIVILAVIAIIAIPIITNVIDKAKKGALKDSAYGILDSAEMYLAKNMNKGIVDTMEFTCNNGKCLSGTEEIDYKGKIESGKVRIYTDSKIELCVTDNKSSALKTVTGKKVEVATGTCDYGELNYGVTALVSKEALDAKQSELDEMTQRLNTIESSLNNALSSNGIEPIDENNDGIISIEEIVDSSATGISNKGEVLYAAATWPGTLSYTATKSCDGTIVTASSNWSGELTIRLTQNGTTILTSNSRTVYQVPVKINEGDKFVFAVTAGSGYYSHMSMTIICLK